MHLLIFHISQVGCCPVLRCHNFLGRGCGGDILIEAMVWCVRGAEAEGKCRRQTRRGRHYDKYLDSTSSRWVMCQVGKVFGAWSISAKYVWGRGGRGGCGRHAGEVGDEGQSTIYMWRMESSAHEVHYC